MPLAQGLISVAVLLPWLALSFKLSPFIDKEADWLDVGARFTAVFTVVLSSWAAQWNSNEEWCGVVTNLINIVNVLFMLGVVASMTIFFQARSN